MAGKSASEGLVSTIIPVYNRPAQLREAVQSVLLQDFPAIEVLVVDDGSTDGLTWQCAQDLARSRPDSVRAVRQSNGGPGAAREHGRQLARGEFIQYLDSDDVLLPGKFTTQVAALRRRPECAAAYGMTRFVYSDKSTAPGPWKGSGIPRETMFPSFLMERWWDTPNPLYRAEYCERAGAWTTLRLEEDWEYDCRIAALGARLVWCDRYVCEVREHVGARLSGGSALDADRMRDRAASHALILSHAIRAGISLESPEMRHFSRALFLLSRQCGAAGLAKESSHLFELSRQAAGAKRSKGMDYRLYRLVAEIFGWKRAGQISCNFDRARAKRRYGAIPENA
jgi:hypothetical protein